MCKNVIRRAWIQKINDPILSKPPLLSFPPYLAATHNVAVNELAPPRFQVADIHRGELL